METWTWTELKALCGSADLARGRIAEGDYRRAFRGVYVRGEVPDSSAVRAAALRRVLPDDVVLSHWAGLWVLGLDVLPRTPEAGGTWIDTLDAVVPRGRSSMSHGTVVSRRAWPAATRLCGPV